MGCRHNADVDSDRLIAAKPTDGSLLQEAQQARLTIDRQIADLVEKQGAAVSRFDVPDLARIGASKSASLVTE